MDFPYQTQRDIDAALVEELSAAGFVGAEEIGRGGFGVVFRCRQEALDRTVAVKVLTAKLSEERERFLREQLAMGRLTGHPNIVVVLQVGETASGCPYLVMPYHGQGSLQARVQRFGPLPLPEVLRVGVEIAGALETAHRLEILHRDVKPANILLTDFGQPALCDFGIAHIADGFTTADGTFTGSPSFTAPEILGGDPPTPASDVYGLGATLFAILTGHAAYERKAGEQVVAQFLRITTDPVPDLRDGGIPDDVARVIEMAMARDPQERPSTAVLGEQLRRLQASHGLGEDAVPLAVGPIVSPTTVATARYPGNLPVELTSFIGRRAELDEVETLLASSRLVTVAGIGGVGKTRLAQRAGTELQGHFADGVWWVELGELRDPMLVTNALVGALGLRDESGKSLREVLINFLNSRRILLVLDNCEHVLDEVVKLVEALLRGCPELRILTTSRERMGIGSEAVVQLAPLGLPDADPEPTLGRLPGYDAISLFGERAVAAVPEFVLTEDNKRAVARICARVDGLPLAIELAAARLRAMSLEQILERLADRFTLLTRGSRAAPTRQQTLACSVDWSYDLCTSAEQRLWARLSVFAGSFDLEAAEDICSSDDLASENVLDVLTSLADKSILVRTETDGGVRFRLLETLREYGREKLSESGEYLQLRRRHLHWYQRLIAAVAANWFSASQLSWIKRMDRETSNWRQAAEFALTDSPRTALAMSPGLFQYSVARGFFSEIGNWLDRALDAIHPEPTADRCHALYAATVIASLRHQRPVAVARTHQLRSLVERMDNPECRSLLATSEAFIALFGGDWDRTIALAETALATAENPIVRLVATMLKAKALEPAGEIESALAWQETALASAESAGEVLYRSYISWAIGVNWWRQGDDRRAEQSLKQCLELAHLIDDPHNAAAGLETLAWIAGAKAEPGRTAVLMGAADALGKRSGAPPAVLPDLTRFHDEYRRGARAALGPEVFDEAWQRGAAMDFAEAVGYALDGVSALAD